MFDVVVQVGSANHRGELEKCSSISKMEIYNFGLKIKHHAQTLNHTKYVISMSSLLEPSGC